MGGARSHDIRDGVLEYDDPRLAAWRKDRFKLFRVNHFSWWEEEMPTSADFNNGWKNLGIHKHKVDYIISHECSTTEKMILCHKKWIDDYKSDALNKYLEDVMSLTEYKKHFFGHYHMEDSLNYNSFCLYDEIIDLTEIE